MTDQHAPSPEAPDTDTDALVSRLRVIEDQPLDARGPAYEQVHDALQSRLEGGDARSQS